MAYYHGIGAPFDRKRAVQLLKNAAGCGDVIARARMAYLSFLGDEIAGIKSDPARGSAEMASLIAPLKALAKAVFYRPCTHKRGVLAKALGKLRLLLALRRGVIYRA